MILIDILTIPVLATGLEIAPILGALSATASAVGTVAGVISARNQAKAQENLAAADARQKQIEADAINRRAAIDLKRQRDLNRQRLARQSAQAARSGFEIGTGTPLDRLANNAATFETEAIDQFANRAQAADRRRFQGLLTREQGRLTGQALRADAISTGLSGIDKTATKFGGLF